MTRIITIIGNCGSGKTTLAGQICALPGYAGLLEQHAERPYQRLAMDDKRWAFHNQVDYLLYRAEQERAARLRPETGVADGGLDQDFYIFARLFYEKGFYSPAEFGVLERLYRELRAGLPAPERVIRLMVPGAMLVERRARRKRELDIATDADLPRIEELLDEFEGRLKGMARVFHLDFSGEISPKDISWQRMMEFIFS